MFMNLMGLSLRMKKLFEVSVVKSGGRVVQDFLNFIFFFLLYYFSFLDEFSFYFLEDVVYIFIGPKHQEGDHDPFHK